MGRPLNFPSLPQNNVGKDASNKKKHPFPFTDGKLRQEETKSLVQSY